MRRGAQWRMKNKRPEESGRGRLRACATRFTAKLFLRSSLVAEMSEPRFHRLDSGDRDSVTQVSPSHVRLLFGNDSFPRAVSYLDPESSISRDRNHELESPLIVADRRAPQRFVFGEHDQGHRGTLATSDRCAARYFDILPAGVLNTAHGMYSDNAVSVSLSASNRILRKWRSSASSM